MRPRPKYLLFALIGLMFLWVLDHSERFLIDPNDGEWMHIQSFKWWLLPHAIAGACALILGPMQFSDRLRQRFIGVHRAVGRLYVTGVFIAAPLGVYIQYLNEPLGFARSFTIESVFHVSDPHSIEIVVWACTASSLFVADLVLQVQETLRMRPRTVKARSTTPMLETV